MADTELTEPTSPNGDRPLPAFVRIDGSPRFSANQLRRIKAETGLALEALTNDPAAIVQAVVFLELSKAGYAVSWDDAGDVPVELGGVDPTLTDNATTSPRSVGSGE